MSPSPEQAYVQLYSLTEDMPFAWRLLGGNNRETGRSAMTFPDEPAARAAVVLFQRELHTYRPKFTRRHDNQWVWQLLRGDQLVAASGRTYDRQARCVQALNSFVRAMRTAPISDTIMVTSTRRWAPRTPISGLVRANGTNGGSR